MAASMHRRKSSKEAEDNLVVQADGTAQPVAANGSAPPRMRMSSMPVPHTQRILASQSEPGASVGYTPSLLNGSSSMAHLHGPSGTNSQSSSPFRNSFVAIAQSQHSHSHSRTRSVSGPFIPSLPSPLSSSFGQDGQHPSPSTSGLHSFPTSSTVPELGSKNIGEGTPTSAHTRRHSRLHSRNLSVFFPRPGSLPPSTIDEDASQETAEGRIEQGPVSNIPHTYSATGSNGSQKRLGEGFTFGMRPSSSLPQELSRAPSGGNRRGHHHKHSLSHNFFSFLEPGTGSRSLPSDLHTQPTVTPTSPWSPVTSFGPSPSSASTSSGLSRTEFDHVSSSAGSDSLESLGRRGLPPLAVVATVYQFCLGAWLWISGQQIGSLACTGLGYWVVFDASGIALSSVLPHYLSRSSTQLRIRRSYGNARIETVLMFAQSVYLIFASVYVCKETVEHLLLSAGEGHHHHYGDEIPETMGLEFPAFLVVVTLISLLSTSLLFNHHSKLVNITGNYIPSMPSIIRSALTRFPTSHSQSIPTSPLALIFCNPFALSPIFFCSSILLVVAFLPLAQYRPFDLVLASIETVVTFNVAYKASVVLGAVLLQTSPSRGLASGRMEAFLRVMREIERHHQVLHLPSPHIWQLTPTPTTAMTYPTSSALGSGSEKGKSLVVTLELHVRQDLGDDDVLALTQWAWERCISALRLGTGAEAEVTVGVVKG